MKIVNFNVNGIRSRVHQIEKVIEKYEPDVICLQEIKCIEEEFPTFGHHGYQAFINGQTGKLKGNYGVAILSRLPLFDVNIGVNDEFLDSQSRSISAKFKLSGEDFFIQNIYFPNGENRKVVEKFTFKEKFYKQVTQNLMEIKKETKNILVMGDMNIAPFDDDIGIGEINKKRWLRDGACCFLPEEREWMSGIFDLGLIDIYDEFIKKQNQAKKYSWFDYRSKGFDKDPKHGLRIDLMLANGIFVDKVSNIDLDYELRAMEKPSDHTALIGEFIL